jgi:hypothetical protein
MVQVATVRWNDNLLNIEAANHEQLFRPDAEKERCSLAALR